MDTLLQYAQLVTAIATLGAFVYAAVQVHQSKRHKRAEFVIQLHNMFVSDKEMMEMFYMIEYGEFVYDVNFHESEDEKKLDKLLGHFNNICKLLEMKVLKSEDIELMHYEICRVAQDDEVYKYFEWLDHWCITIGIKETKFESLRRYASALK